MLSIELKIWLFHICLFWIKQVRKLQKCKLICRSLLWKLKPIAMPLPLWFVKLPNEELPEQTLEHPLVLRVLKEAPQFAPSTSNYSWGFFFCWSFDQGGPSKCSLLHCAKEVASHTIFFSLVNPHLNLKYHLHPVNLVQTRILRMTYNHCVKHF